MSFCVYRRGTLNSAHDKNREDICASEYVFMNMVNVITLTGCFTVFVRTGT